MRVTPILPPALIPKIKACNCFMNYTKVQSWLKDKPFFNQVSSQPNQLLFLNCSKTPCAKAAKGMKFLTIANNLSLNANIARTLESTEQRKLFTDQSFTAHPGEIKHTKLCEYNFCSLWVACISHFKDKHYSYMGVQVETITLNKSSVHNSSAEAVKHYLLIWFSISQKLFLLLGTCTCL